MINYLFYFIGILIGLLIMLIIVYDSGDITKLFKNTKEFFGNTKSEKDELTDNINIVKIVDIPLISSDIDTVDEKDSNNVINDNTVDHFNFFKLLKAGRDPPSLFPISSNSIRESNLISVIVVL